MLPEFIHDHWYYEIAFSFGVFAASFLVSRIVNFVFEGVLHQITKKTKTTLDDLVVHALRSPITLLVVVVNTYAALTIIKSLDAYQGTLEAVFRTVLIFTAGFALHRVVSAFGKWYSTEVASRTESDLDDRLLPIAQRVVIAIIYAVTLMIALDTLGVSVSPLMASLGIGGLAVALALQPTLSSFIASAYLVSDGRLGAGHMIQIEGGPTGTIQDIGWRTTKILTPLNNIVIIPNSKLADSIVTDYMAPNSEVAMVVPCGVSYSSDLEHVRKVALEVAAKVAEEQPGAVKAFTPVVRFFEFGDSNINFNTVFRAKDFGSQFAIRDAYIPALHKRFNQEGIEIAFPTRKLVFEAGGQAKIMSAATNGGTKHSAH
ncbi:MAG: mechanosensitive ion channel family protein [SAR202 cluster bacterium]|nr:mechanosensitive ion channel family protein [SAR202 cluster bacterium]